MLESMLLLEMDWATKFGFCAEDRTRNLLVLICFCSMNGYETVACGFYTWMRELLDTDHE